MPEFHITRRLHEEHMAVLNFLERLDAKLRDGVDEPFLRELTNVIAGEVGPHFDLEEQALFPLVREYGDDDLVDLLDEEHQVIRPLGKEVIGSAEKLLNDGVDGPHWPEFRRLTGEFSERLASHASKEEMSLVPLLDEILDADVDNELSLEYA